MTAYIKYPKILHLPWSEGVDVNTDLVFAQEDVESSFRGREVIVTEKMDGENCSMYRDHTHARSLDSRHHPSRNWVKRLHASIAHEIPVGLRICSSATGMHQRFMCSTRWRTSRTVFRMTLTTSRPCGYRSSAGSSKFSTTSSRQIRTSELS